MFDIWHMPIVQTYKDDAKKGSLPNSGRLPQLRLLGRCLAARAQIEIDVTRSFGRKQSDQIVCSVDSSLTTTGTAEYRLRNPITLIASNSFGIALVHILPRFELLLECAVSLHYQLRGLGLTFAGRENQPMTVQLNNVINTTTGERLYNLNMAATILTSAVPLLVYLISGRWFVRGIAAGAVK